MSPYSRAPFTVKRAKRISTPRVMLVVGIIILCIVSVWLLSRLIVGRSRSYVPPIYPDVVELGLRSKRSLISKVIELETTINSYEARLSEVSVLRDENEKLKAEFDRRITDNPGILTHVLTLPNRSFYNVIIVDGGTAEGIHAGATAYAFGNIALGTVSYADTHTATVELFSAPGKETTGTVVGSDVAVTMIGRGGGEYEVRMPREVKFDIGNMISHQSVQTAILAQIEKVATDPRDPFQRLYAKAPVNLQALKWVIIR